MPCWYVEFHGPEPTQEIGTTVDADNGDDAIDAAREKVADEWNGEHADMLHDDDETVFDFRTKYVARVVRIWVS
jgi:hypothetical protein